MTSLPRHGLREDQRGKPLGEPQVDRRAVPRGEVQHLLEQIKLLQRDNAQLRDQAHNESSSRLMAEAALGKTEDHLQLAVDAAGLAIWEWDILDETLFASSRFMETVDSVDPESDEALQNPDWSPKDLMRRAGAADRELLRQALVRVFRQDDARLEVELQIKTGHQKRWIECTGDVIQRNMLGQVERMAGISRDVTRRRDIQQEVEAARAQAVAANAAKDEFLAHISHEIRTPLNGVIGMNNLLAQTELTPEQRQYVELVGSSGRALLALVNDVLDYSRLEARMLMLEQVRFPLRKWLWDVVAPLRVAAQAKGLELRLQAGETLPKEAVGDPGRLRQIVTNLVSNAIKFTEQGRVDVSMDLTAETATHMTVQLQVSDTGIGIAVKKQQSIFGAFVQADNSTSRRYGGTGLGLSICAKLVNLMGGKIDVNSTPDQGSCFTLQVPLGQSQSFNLDADFGQTELAGVEMTTDNLAQRTSLEGQGHNYAGKRALVVDDFVVNQLLATRLLEKMGFEVEAADDGARAIEAVFARRFDLVLMDIQMPQMDGWQATHYIRQWEHAHSKIRVPIIALSANAAAADREHAISVGMDGYLTKPLTNEALRAGLQATGLGLQSTRAELTAAPDTRPADALPSTLVSFSGRLAGTSESMAKGASLAATLAAASGASTSISKPSLRDPEPSTQHVPLPLVSAPVAAQPQTTSVSERSREASQPGLVNRARMLTRLGDDESALRAMSKAFSSDLRNCMGLAFEAMQNQNWVATAANAHALKGLLLSITAEAAAKDARALEVAARAGDSSAAKTAFSLLSESARVAFDTVRRW